MCIRCWVMWVGAWNWIAILPSKLALTSVNDLTVYITNSMRRKVSLIFLVSLLNFIIFFWNVSTKDARWGICSTHWDFLPKFLSLHYYTTLEGALGVKRSGQAQETIICIFGQLFFSQNGMTFKNLQKLSKSSEKLLFFGILSEFVQFWLNCGAT